MTLKDFNMKRFVAISAAALLIGFTAGNALSLVGAAKAEQAVIWIEP